MRCVVPSKPSNCRCGLVSGVEISTGWEHHEIHVVALGVDEKNPQLVAFLAGQRARRETRALEIGRRLEKCLIPGTYEEAKALAGDAAVTRAHLPVCWWRAVWPTTCRRYSKST